MTLLDEVTREAWRRRKDGEPLDPIHREAERAYQARRAEETQRVSLPADLADRIALVAKQAGLSARQYTIQIFQLAVSDAIVERGSHDAIVDHHAKRVERLERYRDDLYLEVAEQAQRVSAAEDAASALAERVFATLERIVTSLDAMGVPEPDRGFLARTNRDMSTDAPEGDR